MVWEHTQWDCESSVLWVKRKKVGLQNAVTPELKQSPNRTKRLHKPQTIWKTPFLFKCCALKGPHHWKKSLQIQGSATKKMTHSVTYTYFHRLTHWSVRRVALWSMCVSDKERKGKTRRFGKIVDKLTKMDQRSMEQRFVLIGHRVCQQQIKPHQLFTRTIEVELLSRKGETRSSC